MTETVTVFAPAKLNWFLHITGQRADGYHSLQTVFELINLADEIQLQPRHDGKIHLITGATGVQTTDDLVYKAAKLLRQKTGTLLGCNIALHKVIPMGAGLGGGSSDAASVLWGLNELWNTKLSRSSLMELGLELGADVPFFLLGTNAFAEGIGEILTPVSLSASTYLLIYPGVHVPTIEVFKSSNLTRNHPKVTISDFTESAHPDQFGKNDCQDVVVQRYQEVAQAIDWIVQRHPEAQPRMTGSGSTVFARLDPEVAQELRKQLPPKWIGFVVQGLKKHPSYNAVS